MRIWIAFVPGYKYDPRKNMVARTKSALLEKIAEWDAAQPERIWRNHYSDLRVRQIAVETKDIFGLLEKLGEHGLSDEIGEKISDYLVRKRRGKLGLSKGEGRGFRLRFPDLD